MNPYLGTIKLFSFDFVPRGWLACDGRLLRIVENTALYSLLGTTYGGDGRETFGLPDMKNKAPAPNLHYALYAMPQYPGSIHPG